MFLNWDLYLLANMLLLNRNPQSFSSRLFACLLLLLPDWMV